MEKLTRCFMSALLLSAVLSSGLAEEKFFGNGGTLELGPNFSGEKINTVIWKLNNNLVAEWVKSINDLTYYDVFEGRTNLDKETGILEIRKMSSNDSGVYRVEINNKVLPESYNAKLIKEVTKPVVLLQPLTCSDASVNCSLLCEGNTEGAGPVTYSWKKDEGIWEDGKKIRDITKDKETQSIKAFSCRMKNPISEKQSDPIDNVFYSEDVVVPSNVGGIVVAVLGVLTAVGVLVGVGYWKREAISKKVESLRGHDNNKDVETGVPLVNGRSDDAGPADGPGAEAGGKPAASTEEAGGERDAPSTEGAGGKPAASTEEAGGEPVVPSAEGAGGQSAAASKEEADGESAAASKEEAGGQSAAASKEEADGESAAASKEEADREPDAGSKAVAGGETVSASKEEADGQSAAASKGERVEASDAGSKTEADDTPL
ncbi:uncharacterized protein LOC133977249 [Scomber scombrus]|uniref:uncharacterized protein LOC133977249 n=1 Tax=Scomber scombrus TaxID=13677 RepID=UPI002DDBB5E0|nr:uncharacterized protein LOC133977249 [Scomber scombrus]